MTAADLSKLTPEQRRVRISNACGWTKEPSPYFRGVILWVNPKGLHSGRDDDPRSGPPDYLNDLNACFDMEQMLTAHQWSDYTKALRKIIKRDRKCERTGLIADFWFYHSTAAQRCEAFLRTVG